jgi:hypothetical protein
MSLFPIGKAMRLENEMNAQGGEMNLPDWMPPQPELPWVEGSLDGDLPPSAVRRWAHEYALAAVEAYKASLRFVQADGRLVAVTSVNEDDQIVETLYRLDEE